MKKKISEKTKTNSLMSSKNVKRLEFPIVGIGASAGGLEALEFFFTNIPSDTGMAFVIVQHLDPNHKSILSDLIKRYTRMQVYQITDGVIVEPNTIYIIPPAANIALIHGTLQLMKQMEPRGLRLPIDYFFKSLAIDQKDKSICIILSGTGTDGTLGLKTIKGANGVVMVQNPQDAKYDGMPTSAINTGLVDYTLDANKMPEKLISYIKYVFDTTGKVPIPAEYSSNYLNKIFTLVRAHTGHDFSFYKQNTIVRRVERRMSVAQIGKIEDYYLFLQENPEEIDVFFKELLIGVTNFFRDTDAFIKLQKVISKLLANKNNSEVIRVWIPGCSTGEEAYTIAILLRNEMQIIKRDFKVQIFATDVDKYAIEKARQAIYPESITADVPAKYLKKYFAKEMNAYLVNKSIRDMIVFAEQSVIKDPPFSKVDLISCRNLLIYLGSELQEKLLPVFHYSLNKSGYLFLGSSETLGKSAKYFTVIDRKWKIFQAKNNINLPNVIINDLPSLPVSYKERYQHLGVKRQEKISFKDIIEKKMLEEYSPSAVLINEKHDILFLKGRTAEFLEPVQGLANMNLLEMVKPEIRIELITALNKSRNKNVKTVDKNLKVIVNGKHKLINIHVSPLNEPPAIRGLYLIVFEDTGKEEESLIDKKEITVTDKNRKHIGVLEQELQRTKEYLQSVIEEAETTNEELKSTNEELQSSNEELQSTNEELETSKEELQSVNEELITVNSEHQNKINELTISNNDINNLLASTEIGTIFLDLDLTIQKFTPKVTEFINLIPTDIYRPIGDIVTKLDYPDFAKDIIHVLNSLNIVEKEITADDLVYICRILPYRTIENIVNGIVITFIDITKQKLREKTISKLSLAVEEANDIILITDNKGIIEYVNSTFETITGYSEKEVVGKNPSMFKSDKFDKEYYTEFWNKLNEGEIVRTEFTNKKKNGDLFYEDARIIPMKDDMGNLTHIIKVANDISEKKYMEQKLIESNKELEIKIQNRTQELKIREIELKQKNNLLENIFSNIHIMIASIDENFKLLNANTNFLRSFDLKEDDYKNENFIELTSDRDIKMLINRAVGTLETHYLFAKPMKIGRKKEVRLYDFTFQALKDSDNKLSLLISIIDITEREKNVLNN